MKSKRKFSSFFKSLVIELDKDLYGPDNHLVEWRRTATTQETDGFQVKRPGQCDDFMARTRTLIKEICNDPPDQRLTSLTGLTVFDP